MDKITLSGGDDYNSSPIKINLEGLDINHNIGGSYGNEIQLKIDGSIFNASVEILKPKIEVLTDLLGKLIQFRESDLAKLSLIDREHEITSLIDSVINKIHNELTIY